VLILPSSACPSRTWPVSFSKWASDFESLIQLVMS
jgi:hypothetical protein